jgi:hypothetical protein
MTTKKRLILLILMLFGFLTNKAQEIKGSAYVFPKYMDGNIKFKVGADVKAKLNYNTVTEEMLYLTPENQALTIAETIKIDTVFINGRKFIPVGTVFYEVIPAGKVHLLARLISKAIPPAANVGIGTSQTTAQSANTKVRTDIGLYDLDLPNYTILPRKEFYLKKGTQYIHIVNANHLALLYPEKSIELKQFAKANRIDFSKTEDIVKLLSLVN